MNVFVAVGTSHFDELVERMDAIASRLDGRVVMQIGIGSYEPRHAAFFRFSPTLREQIAAADLVVCHGGFGILTESLEQGKRVVGVENSAMYDNHQVELLTKFAGEGYITWCRDLATLDEAIRAAAASTPRAYERPPCTIGARIREFLGAGPSAAADGVPATGDVPAAGRLHAPEDSR